MKKMKKYFVFGFLLLNLMLIALCACNVKETEQTPNTEVPQYYSLEYLSTEGGRISGESEQLVKSGESGSAVKAIPDEGYQFIMWLDSEDTNPERIDSDVTSNVNATAIFKRLTYTVKYETDGNGTIEGETSQTVAYKGNTEIVTAVPDKGYKFAGWSDGLEEATRFEKNLKVNMELTACFKPITKEFKYDYKYADRNCDAETIELVYGQSDKVKFAVPEREHSIFGGWYADKFLTQQVADEKGNAIFKDELFFEENTQLYAKWISENTNTYKVLIIYVTELNALLTTTDGKSSKLVDYKMTDTERKICQMTTERISFELNDLAVANFQVDGYFTTVPLTKENVTVHRFLNLHNQEYVIENAIDAFNIPDVQDKLDKYDSILVSFSMNDFYNELSIQSGAAGAKYGYVHFDGRFTQLIYFHEPIENLLDPLHFYWPQFIGTYLHEFAHTIHLRVNDIIGFHDILAEYNNNNDQILSEKLYFLNKAVVNGETVGVPYEFWEGKVAKVFYEAQEGGKIYNEKHSLILRNEIRVEDDLQYVLYGRDAMSVTATASEGYEFIGWSDGVETATRKDINILQDLHVYAMFKPIE